MFGKIQPALKKELKNVLIYIIVGLVLMWILLWILHGLLPQTFAFDYTVFVGGILGGCVAELNFLFLGLTVQNVAASEDDEKARMIMKTSYSKRMGVQVLWLILAIVLPFVNPVAGIAPLIFPSAGIKLFTAVG